MAQLKDLIVLGNSRFIDKILSDNIQINSIEALTASNSSTYGPGTNGQILKSNGTSIYWGADNNTDTKVTNTLSTTTKFYVTGTSSSSTNTGTQYFDTGVYVDTTAGKFVATKVYGAVFNDYAEYRKTDSIEPGRCVVENGDDTLSLSISRMQPGAEIISDTFGFAIGETDECKTPVAVTGRVLAYPYEDREEFRNAIGRPVCSGPNGTVSLMSDEEYQKYGYCTIGFVSAVPDYEEWGTGKAKVNNRVWIRIK